MPRASQLYHRMCLQGGSKAKQNLQIRKAIRIQPSAFEKFNTTAEDIVSKITNHVGLVALDHCCWGFKVVWLFCFITPEIVTLVDNWWALCGLFLVDVFAWLLWQMIDVNLYLTISGSYYTFCRSLPENILSLTPTSNSLTQKHIYFIQSTFISVDTQPFGSKGIPYRQQTIINTIPLYIGDDKISIRQDICHT